jgi:CubicO group peptidase (beta-lactamase class C family)
MKKYIKRILWVIVVLLLIPVAYMAIYFPPVMSGMTAKMACSCVYVMGRSVESVREKELQVFSGMSSAGIEIGSDSSVTAQILWSKSKAVYRKGFGCTLLAERSESEIRNQKILLPKIPALNQDTIAWPQGNLLSTDRLNVDYSKINSILDSAFVNDLDKPLNTLGIVVVYGGQIIGEQYAEGFSSKSKLMGWSMAKSITSTLIGLLVREGKLNVLDPAPIDEWQGDDRKNIRIENLLQATSGLSWEEGYFDPRSHFHNMFTYSDDKAGYALSQKLESPIGSVFQYSSGTTNILSKIVRQKVGDSAYYQFPYEKLFYKIGMNSMVFEPDASGTFVGSSYAYATARDWARFGLLYLNDGMWGSERILPEGWVEFTATPSQVVPLGEYGAQWHLNVGDPSNPENRTYRSLPTDTFWADGFEEQYVMVIPSKNLVVVRLGVSHHGSPFEKMVADIIKCLEEEVQ